MNSSNLCDGSNQEQCVQIYHKFGIEVFYYGLKNVVSIKVEVVVVVVCPKCCVDID